MRNALYHYRRNAYTKLMAFLHRKHPRFQYCQVFYEDFCHTPETHMARILESLELTPTLLEAI